VHKNAHIKPQCDAPASGEAAATRPEFRSELKPRGFSLLQCCVVGLVHEKTSAIVGVHAPCVHNGGKLARPRLGGEAIAILLNNAHMWIPQHSILR
jgi:hypothetical protein